METKENKAEKKLYLIAYEPDTRTVTYAQELPRSAGPQTKYYADRFLRKLDPEFRERYHFAVVVSEGLNSGCPVDSEIIQPCFMLV